MILAIDVGNTQIVIGVYRNSELFAHWRISTYPLKTGDEIAGMLASLLENKNLKYVHINAMVVSSVVPDSTQALKDMAARYFNFEPLFVSPGIKTGIPILYDNPHEVGADRIANAVAGFHLYGGPLIVVDFGTAITFDAISKKGEYLGGAIAPGIAISSDALFKAAAKLSRVDIVKPRSVIGKNTVESLQSGILFGFAGQVDTMVNRIKEEIGSDARVVATGGLVDLILSECKTIDEVNPLLTLTGLQIIYEKNKQD